MNGKHFMTTLEDVPTDVKVRCYDAELFDAFWLNSDRGIDDCVALCRKCFLRSRDYWLKRGKDMDYVITRFFLGVSQALEAGEPLDEAIFDMAQIACECDL